MGAPLIVSIIQVPLERVRFWRRIAASRNFIRRPDQAGLPVGPLAYLTQLLGAHAVRVALVPVPAVSVHIERVAVFARRYVLWVSIGAIKTLSPEELEALLWHECGHAGLLGRRWWRGPLTFLTPATARFVDLADDLYEEERRADLFAAEKMGTADPLLSVLRKAKKESRAELESKKQAAGQVRKGATMLHIRMVWDLRWAGYLHPDLDQRIQWLSEVRSPGTASGTCTI
jgi:Zn-dependent protease with chaperone function